MTQDQAGGRSFNFYLGHSPDLTCYQEGSWSGASFVACVEGLSSIIQGGKPCPPQVAPGRWVEILLRAHCSDAAPSLWVTRSRSPLYAEHYNLHVGRCPTLEPGELADWEHVVKRIPGLLWKAAAPTALHLSRSDPPTPFEVVVQRSPPPV